MSKYYIWSDGACKGNPGPGGIGYLIRDEFGNEQVAGIHEPDTTNNRMELTAAILAIAAITEPAHIVLTTDSNYVKQGITEWIHNWKKKNWKTAQGKPVKNQDLWVILDQLVQNHTMEWCWVKGHSKDPENDRVDKLASDACYK